MYISYERYICNNVIRTFSYSNMILCKHVCVRTYIIFNIFTLYFNA